MTLYLLKVHLQTFLSIPITKKCQILSCDILVVNEGYINTRTPKKNCARLTQQYGVIMHAGNKPPDDEQLFVRNM